MEIIAEKQMQVEKITAKGGRYVLPVGEIDYKIFLHGDLVKLFTKG